jgi:ATP-dependent Clp protease adapter protein ClpS
MSPRKMVKPKKKKYSVVLFNDSINEYLYVVDVLKGIVGMELTQAENAANLAQRLGSYVIKSLDELQEAEAYVDLLLDCGLNVELHY